jgi:tetratricopeptide (TPR) repeat protein
MTRHNASNTIVRPAAAARLGMVLVLLPLLATPALAASKTGQAAKPSVSDTAAEVNACLKQAERDADSALAMARAWEGRGGGDLARLCAVTARFHQGDFEAAATGFEQLVPTLGAASPEQAATLLARAGWSWLRAGKPERAEQAYSAALVRRPRDADLLIDRAFARADAEKYWDAVEDLNLAIQLKPDRADSYVYRAGALRALGQDSKAADDIAQALHLDPRNAEALLQRGNLRALGGNTDAARQDWQLVQQIEPGGSSARAAAENLKRLDQPASPAK